MGLFGNLFEKKECSVCGGEIGLLGNRKLEDGNLCKECAKKLSPWFSERRHSTVEEIKQQLAYREENKKKAAQFKTTRSLGVEKKILIDENHRWITVTRSSNLVEDNPDILDFSAVTGCRMDIDENRTEIMRNDKDGNRVSYNPPRYQYSYNFDIIVSVSNPYFDEMRFRLNDSTIEMTYTSAGVSTGSALGNLLNSALSGGFDPMNNSQYRQYYQLAESICAEVLRLQNPGAGAAVGGAAYAAAPQYAQPGVPQYGQPGAAQYAQPGVPQYGQPGVPQYGQPGAAQYAQPGVPQYGQPGVAQYAQPGVPQYGQPGAAQYAQQVPNAAAYAAAPQYAQPQAAPVSGPWTCPACGGQNNGSFCEFCGTKRP